MPTVETIGEAWNFSWRITMRCLDDGMRGLKHGRECDFRTELDLQTLVCTRGRDFPLAQLSERLRCPRCGCRRVAVMFGPSTVERRSVVAARRYDWRSCRDESDD